MRERRQGANALATAIRDWRIPGRTLSQALAGALRESILDGRLPVGVEMPSERALAGALGVSRSTLVAALALLRRDGWLSTRHGSGSRTRLSPTVTDRTTPWSLDHPDTGLELDMIQAVTAAPHDAYLAAVRAAAAALGPLLLADGTSSPGLPVLREIIATRYTREGLPTNADQILVTSGATAALHLLLDQLHDRRRPVLVENPTYRGALAALRRRRARIAVFPVTAEGWDVQHIDQAVTISGATLAFLMPDFHNPTGVLMPTRDRLAVNRLVNRHQLTLIVDETMRDLDLRMPAVPPPHLCGRNVIHIGSASKTVWSGLRIGWIRARGPLIRELLRNPLQLVLSPPPFEQLIAIHMLAEPSDLLRVRRQQLRRQRDHLAVLLAEGTGWSYTVPAGGLTLWLQTHRVTGRALVAAAYDRGLALVPGPGFSANGTLTRHVRVPFTAHPSALTRAVAILRDAEAAARP